MSISGSRSQALPFCSPTSEARPSCTTGSATSSPSISCGRISSVLNEIVAAEAGAVVKTIGDAVMATFPTPDRAMAAALRMRQAMRAFNTEHGAGGSAAEDRHPRGAVPRGRAQRAAGLFRADGEYRLARARSRRIRRRSTRPGPSSIIPGPRNCWRKAAWRRRSASGCCAASPRRSPSTRSPERRSPLRLPDGIALPSRARTRPRIVYLYLAIVVGQLGRQLADHETRARRRAGAGFRAAAPGRDAGADGADADRDARAAAAAPRRAARPVHRRPVAGRRVS